MSVDISNCKNMNPLHEPKNTVNVSNSNTTTTITWKKINWLSVVGSAMVLFVSQAADKQELQQSEYIVT